MHAAGKTRHTCGCSHEVKIFPGRVVVDLSYVYLSRRQVCTVCITHGGHGESLVRARRPGDHQFDVLPY